MKRITEQLSSDKGGANDQDRSESRKKHDNQEGTEIFFQCHGEAYSIIEESIAIIRTIMDNLKKKDEVLHLLVLDRIQKHPEILTCQNVDKIKVLEEREIKISKNGEMKS